jgi:hypothetical protein
MYILKRSSKLNKKTALFQMSQKEKNTNNQALRKIKIFTPKIVIDLSRSEPIEI